MDPQQVRLKAKYLRQQQQNARIRHGSRLVGLSLGGTALAIYFYSMYMIKQETVIKEIDEANLSGAVFQILAAFTLLPGIAAI